MNKYGGFFWTVTYLHVQLMIIVKLTHMIIFCSGYVRSVYALWKGR